MLDDETAAALTLYNAYLVADREQQAHERALKKAEKAKDDAAAAVRKLNDRKAPAAETAEAEARYREAAEALQCLRGGDTAAPDAGDDNTEDDTSESAAEDAAGDEDTAGEQAEDAATENTDDAATEDTPPEDTAGEQAEDSEDAAPEDTTSDNPEDTASEDADETSVGVEASVGDEDLAGDEPAGVAG